MKIVPISHSALLQSAITVVLLAVTAVLSDSTIRCAEPRQPSKFVTLYILIPVISSSYFMYHQV